MRRNSMSGIRLMATGRILSLVTLCFAAACASSGARKPGVLEVQEGGGFTITEQVRFGARVRSDFDDALELIEEERYEDGIALLQKVTEAAPEATSAHIDLGMAHRPCPGCPQ